MLSSGQGGLKWEDIVGASPAKFKRGRKLFIDRNEVKSVLGQSPGKYHGFANDYTNGGTYKPEEESNIIISDYRKITKNKVANKSIFLNNGARELNIDSFASRLSKGTSSIKDNASRSNITSNLIFLDIKI